MAVETGWQGLSEVNRVVFDPQKVTVQQMVEWLKKAGTYIRTLEQEIPQAQPSQDKYGKP